MLCSIFFFSSMNLYKEREEVGEDVMYMYVLQYTLSPKVQAKVARCAEKKGVSKQVEVNKETPKRPDALISGFFICFITLTNLQKTIFWGKMNGFFLICLQKGQTGISGLEEA